MQLNVVWQLSPVREEMTFPYKVVINNHRLKEIRYFLIVARGLLKTLAYHSLPEYWMQKIQQSWNKMCDN